MKRIITIVIASTITCVIASAQEKLDFKNPSIPEASDGNKTGMEWIEEYDGKEIVKFNPNYGDSIVYDDFYLMSMHERLLALYGSRYRKAGTRKSTGIFLTTIAPSVFIAGLIAGANDLEGVAWLSMAGTVACLGAGIPLWIKGRKDLDSIYDDYAKNYGARPYSSSLTIGPTLNGVGLSFNF